MKNSAVMEIAVAELTGAVNQIAQTHNITPTLMKFVMSAVMCKLSDMAVSELSEEVVNLELKIAKISSKTDDKPTETKIEKEAKSERVSVGAKSKSVRKSGTIDDLIADLKASGVKVTETRKTVDSNGNETIEDVVDEVKKNDNTNSDNQSDTE